MHTTSHFIGISLGSSYFADLFVELQAYFKRHDLERAVEFQNILSLHITLYYLEGTLDTSAKAKILQDVSAVATADTLDVWGLKVGYFGDPGQERVCYLGCARNERFEELNQFFAKKYDRSQIPENQLSFVPHISLFRILSPGAYASHKQEIDALIHKALQTIDPEHAVTGLRLFQVNSAFHPEIQITLERSMPG